MNALGKQVEAPAADDGWYSQAQAAKVLGVSPHLVLSRALGGELEARKFGGRWFFSRASVQRALGGGR